MHFLAIFIESIRLYDYKRNTQSFQDFTVLLIGITLLAGAVLVRTSIEGAGWWQIFLQSRILKINLSKRTTISKKNYQISRIFYAQ
jgi:hypothetical protein